MKRSLASRIIVTFLAILIVSGAVLSGVSQFYAKNIIKSELTESANDAVLQTQITFDNFFTSLEKELSIVSLDNSFKSGDNQAIQQKLNEFLSINDSLMNVVYGNPQKEFLLSPEQELPEGYDPTSRPWYIGAVEKKEGIFWTEPYIDAGSGMTTISASKALYDGDELLGVLSLDVSLEALSNSLNTIEIGENGYIAVYSEKGDILVHKDKEKVGANVEKEVYFKELISLKDDKGNLIITEDNEEKMVTYKKIDKDLILTGIVFVDDFNQTANKMIPVLIITFVGTVLLTYIITKLMITRLMAPIKDLTRKMKEVEKGDFTVHSDFNSKDEIGSLSSGFNHMISQVRGMIQTIEQTADEVKNASEIMVTNSSENATALDEVARSIEQIADGAVSSSDLSDRNVQNISELSNKIQHIGNSSNEMKIDSEKMFNASKTGAQKVNLLKEQSQKTNKMTSEMVEAIHSLDNNSHNISRIITTITEIAEQTNLLSLNAAIEAARAGESGRGFAVVADEVRKLAEKSAHSSKEIEVLIQKMQNDTGGTVKLIEETSRVIQEQNDIVLETEKSFDSITGTVESNTQKIEEIVRDVKGILELKEKIVKDTMESNNHTQETAASTEEVSASIEEQNASMQQLSALAEKLSEQADKLIDEFKNIKR